MKKLLLVMLASLFLCGCSEKAATGSDSDPEATTESVYIGTYEKNSALEQESGGAIRQFRPGDRNYTRITAMGSQLLLLAEGETTALELFTGPDCACAAVTEIRKDLSQTQWQVTETGFFYYDKEKQQIICLDTSLVETQRVSLPDDITGEPMLSGNGKEVLYCRGQELRAMDIRQGIHRLIRSHACISQEILASCFDGTAVLCRLTQDDGTGKEIMVSAENGSVLWEAPGIVEITTTANRYYTYRMDGVTPQYLCGKTDADPVLLSVPHTVVPALEMEMLVGISAGEQGTVLNAYSADTGSRIASVALKDMAAPVDIWADSRNQRLWLLMDGGILLSWDPAASAVNDDTVYAGIVYTADNPDTDALEALQSRVDAINQQHKVSVRIWQEAVKNPGSHLLGPEYQPTAISACLDTLEQLLSRFPADFLRKSVSTGIRICIVRSADGGTEPVQYWEGSDAFIILPCGSDVEHGFLKALGYIVDVHILGNSPLADQWGELNPPGFTYGQTGDPGDAFLSAKAMASVTDDRALVFYYAMLPENETLFASDTMQQKLRTLCKAIRDAWGWERKSEVYPWEQYLKESIAYKK